MIVARRARFTRCCDSKHDWLTFGHDQNIIVNAGFARTRKQARERFIERFVTEAKGAVVHRHQFFCPQFQESLDCFFRVHVHFAAARRVVSADRQQRNFDFVAFPDLLEPGEIGAITAMKNGATVGFDDKPAEAAMQIREKTCTPMVTRGE